MSTILAKSKNETTLLQHTKEMVNQLQKINITDDKLKNMINYAVICHDFGKVLPTFQNTIHNKDYIPMVLLPNFPHSLFSLLWINLNYIKEKFPEEEDQKLLYSAIAFHHWRNNFEEIIFDLSVISDIF
ncbi:MAG: hypothetical protein ACFWT2_11420 [Thermoanaerobacterium thermosaccharolyticum]|jgi:CRISPR-associated endonuclease/helicase Cas3